jgi:hypothetical protein
VKRAILILLTAVLSLAGTVAHAQSPASFRVLLGVTDSASTRWDGTITARQAGNFKAEGWRFEGVDNIDGSLFHLNTHPPRGALNQGAGGIVANGFIINADGLTESSEFSITTAQGDFTFRAAEVPYGPPMKKTIRQQQQRPMVTSGWPTSSSLIIRST